MKPVRVAAAQVAPVYMDRAATLAKAADTIREAARNGAELVAFPEAFVPGYPFWAMALDPMSINPFLQRLYAESLTLPSPALDPVLSAACESGASVCLGLSERVGGTLYNSQLFIGPDGGIVGRRRKLVPTTHERMVWGRGDGTDLRVFDLPFGRTGALICYEHSNALFRYALSAQGEEVHIAMWPGLAGISSVVDAACRHHAFEAQAFVVNVTSVLTPEILAALGPGGSVTKLQPGGGYTAIVAPRGDFLAGPLRDGEAILYADLDPALIDKAKSIVDTAGHYARPDVVTLHLHLAAQTPLVIHQDRAHPPLLGTMLGIHHVQLAMPAGGEEEARNFYSRLLGITEVPKPPELAKRGGVWFEDGAVKIHLGVEADFRPARKAHPALLARDLRALVERLREAEVDVVEDPLEGYYRVYVADPFGNRLELMEPLR